MNLRLQENELHELEWNILAARVRNQSWLSVPASSLGLLIREVRDRRAAEAKHGHHAHHNPDRTNRGVPQRKLRVQCTIEVEVEYDLDSPAQFMIEENSCPGTGAVGAAIDAAMEYGEKSGVCWGCNLKGENKIISSDPPLEADPE